MSDITPFLFLAVLVLILMDNRSGTKTTGRLPKWTIPVGIAFFFVGATVVALVLGDSSGKDECRNRGGIAVQSVDSHKAVCISPEALR